MEGHLVCIGLGGIFEGYFPHVLLFHAIGIIRFSQIVLVDGKQFREENRARQYYQQLRSKAVERREHWEGTYPDLPLRSRVVYVDASNVQEIVPDGAIVLLSPDNHATRKVVSEHAETLPDILLISGGNDGIDKAKGEDGTEGAVIVHWRKESEDLTAPLTLYHPEIREPDDRLPSAMSCMELAQAGQPQLLATNLLVGHAMAQLLHRYAVLPREEAVQVVEVGVNSRDGTIVPYGIEERQPKLP